MGPAGLADAAGSPGLGDASARPARRGLALRVTNLRRDYGQGPVLDGLSFCLNAGDTLSVLGPSGCGKSTLLTLLAGLDRPDGGEIRLEAVPPDGLRSSVMFQDYGLFPWKTVEDNVALPLRLAGLGRAARRERVAAALEEMGLGGLGRRWPARLSGGQRQRVALARALITRPDLLLMDEPFSSLDALTRARLHGTLLDLWRRRRPICVLVTHSVEEAALLGRYIMVLSALPARVVAWLGNPCFGAPRAASHPGFFDLTRRLHAALAAGAARAGAKDSFRADGTSGGAGGAAAHAGDGPCAR
ncbi:MAG: ABC transporter ATP-binding protein [Desulfovibrionaceae bacterium]|nr:ABC transporter ATP-binding protein [Desulfovibrionaceae bacterium]